MDGQDAATAMKLANEESPPDREGLPSTEDHVGSHHAVELPIPPPSLPPPPRLHVTTERIPVLPSAPPSGADLSAFAEIGETFGDSGGAASNFTSRASTASPPVPQTPATVTDLPPPPRMSGSAGATLVSLPPPPPPLLVQEDTAPVTSEQEAQQQHMREPTKVFFPPSPSTPPFLASRQTHIPILVISTEHANQMAWKNNLRLTDLLGGLSRDLASANVPLPPFRSSNRSMLLNWKDLQVKFLFASDFEEGLAEDDALAQAWLHEEAALQSRDGDVTSDMTLLEDQIDHLLADNPPVSSQETDESDTHTMDLHKERQRRLEQVTRDAYRLTSPPDIPWLVRYRSTLDATTDYLPHELFHAPPLVLLVCSSHELISPLDCLRDLGSLHYLPQAFFGRTGIMDPHQLRKEALVLHDEVDGPKDLNEVALKQAMQRQYGSGATVVRMNSVTPATAQLLAEQEGSDIWNSGGRSGHCLSTSDRASLRRYIATMVTSSLLPALERRIADLNVNVTDKKRGVKNVFKSLWRKPKEEASPTRQTTTKGGVAYRYDSIESQVRLLADTLFLMRDWEAAHGMYRLIKDDYKHDKATMHYASVQEMMALSSYMLDSYGRSREVFSFLETALYNYTRVAEDDRPAGISRPTQATVATRLATRLCLVMSSMSQIERPLEVADLLASASSHETPLGAAVLLEQSSAHYYQAEMFRKYAFHMLMSGHMFRSAAQEHHAFRCFTSALYIYQDGRWDELHNHLRSALAAQLYSLGRMAVSLELYAKLVGTDGGGRVSVKSQQKFVNHLLDICKQHSEKALEGADKMATPGTSNIEVRKARFDRMDQVLTFTPHSRRILELPNMDLPHLDESSITVMVEAEAKEQHEFIPSFGTCNNGDESVWEDLMCSAEAELKIANTHTSQSTEDDLPSALAVIDDPIIRQTIAQIDKEKMNLNIMARAKKSANQKQSPAVQARMEPLLVEFSMHNPLNVPIELTDIQLVATLVASESRCVCTSEDAISIDAPETSTLESKKWTFQSSNREFKSPEFGRISPTDGQSGTGAWKSTALEEAYFVVTKEDLTIDSGSEVRVSLGICPLVKGDLEIVGVRSRLFNDVWIYQPLHVKGPLLQDTSFNRANRVRAESMMLKSQVKEDMPRLTAHLIPRGDSTSTPQEKGDSPMLLGQISAWTLQLTNAGTAPANLLTLKTNMPWIRLEAHDQKPLRETAPLPHCVGPSGTLLSIPLHSPSLKQEGIIHPGETVDVPILIRSAVGGKQDFYMLYRYELCGDSGQKSRCRWLRKMVEVPVYPSLTFTASLMPSFWKKKEHVLSVEMTNYRSDQSTETSVHIDKLSILSRHYRIEPLQNQLADTATDASAIRLGWQERVTMHYRVIPLESKSEVCTVTECPLDGGSTTVVRDYTAAEAGGFLCLKHAHEEFQVAMSMHQMEIARATAEENGSHPRSIAQIRRAKSSVSEISDGYSTDTEEYSSDPSAPAHPTSIARLCPAGDSVAKINIICSWSTSDEGADVATLYGQNYVTGLSVRQGKNNKGCPLSITSKHPPFVSHNFERGPLYVPFDVTVRNRLLEDDVEFEFSMERPKASFDYIGAEHFEWALSAGEEITVPMQAAVMMGGVYDLQSVRITTTHASKSVSYVFPLQWTVVVEGITV